MIRRYAPWCAGLFAAFYLFTNPAGAAHTVNTAASTLQSWGRSLSIFVNNLGG